jgi:hypothetical protein
MVSRRSIFIGLSEVAGYNFSLKQGFDEIGVRASFYDLGDHPFVYSSSAVRNPYIGLIKVLNRRAGSASHALPKYLFLLAYFASIVPLFVWALCRFDTFIFSFAQSFLRFHDLPILKFFGKKIIFVFLGSDSRPPYLNRKFHNNGRLAETIKLTQQIKKNISRIEGCADVIVNHPPTSQFHQKKFVQFLKIGIPTAFGFADAAPTSVPGALVRILHAPSYIEGKGTDRIRLAIASLQAKGFPIVYTEIINRPNVEVLAALKACDFVVDELYSDTYMARFAAEAAFFGKPSIVGSYASAADMGDLCSADIPPLHHCHPDEVERSIERLVSDVAYRTELGRQAHDFVLTQWSPKAVATRFMVLVSGDIPAAWLADPQQIRYLHGWGAPSGIAQTALSQYLAAAGPGGLELDDKPVLKDLLIKFAAEQTPAC